MNRIVVPLAGFFRRASGSGDPPPLVAAAAHEAGHVIAAWDSEFVIHVHSANILPDGTGQTCTSGWDRLTGNVGGTFDNAVAGLAGAAGEFAAFGRFSAKACLPDVKRVALSVPWLTPYVAHRINPWCGEMAGSGPPASMLSSDPIPAEAWMVFDLCLRRGLWLIARKREGFDRIRRILERKHKIGSVELAAILGPKETF